ncbi:hypothetical protein HMI49_03885 [Corallococcus exercitus]|uniref:Uncharacterized protein n=1 Tax=Corallococcus exercitus TaxID=2316736 RepID=A0A7Y4KER2_9BACT|nr:hypothetical protein [Corallococcus exercitus]NOK32341.1 hypothetical protein [Corallococcus exercitus]
MTAKSDLKQRIRERMTKTGESYTTARMHVLGVSEAAAGKPRVNSRPEPKAIYARDLEITRYWTQGLEVLVPATAATGGPFAAVHAVPETEVALMLSKGFRKLTSEEEDEAYGQIEDFTADWQLDD